MEQASAPENSNTERAIASALPPFPVGDETTDNPEHIIHLPVDHYGTTVYVRSLAQKNLDKPPLVLVHDLGEHGDCYHQAAQSFFSQGYSVYTYDWRGHGRSGWQLGHAPSFAVLVQDLLQVVAWARHRAGGQGPVIIGQGVGALMVMEFTKRFPAFCSGAVLSAPCLELQSAVGGLQALILRLLADVLPTARVWQPFVPRFTSGRVNRRPMSREDGELNTRFSGITAALASEVILAMKRAETRFIEFDGSVLILCPEQDQICSYQHLKKSAALHGDHNVQILDLKNTTHGVLTEADDTREDVVALILGWLGRVVVRRREPSVEFT
ncbi:MAG: alpha/beta hydrolase [Deltaproteobacteria bacterium]|nr:alpha/beta hydrolase [Deltaproteobacteria bacterium]